MRFYQYQRCYSKVIILINCTTNIVHLCSAKECQSVVCFGCHCPPFVFDLREDLVVYLSFFVSVCTESFEVRCNRVWTIIKNEENA